MNKIYSSFSNLLLLMSLIVGCTPDTDDCYTCKKQISYQSRPDEITFQTKTERVCSDYEAYWKEITGWTCPKFDMDAYLASHNNTESNAGYVVYLEYPDDYAQFVALDTTLTWSVLNLNPYDVELTFNVYLDTVDPPEQIVIEGIKELSYSPSLTDNTTYFWQVQVYAEDYHQGPSPSRSFKTTPIITHGNYTDERDGNIYSTVTIGDQTWMGENLAYEIPGKLIENDSLWKNTLTFDGWCYYNNDKDSLGSIYGVLYQYVAAQNVCPSGWHLPTSSEWHYLVSEYLNGELRNGGVLKEADTLHWISPNEGATNLFGFTALPGGKREGSSSYLGLGKYGTWWGDYDIYGTNFGLSSNNYIDFTSYPYDYFKREGKSVRCIKD